MTGSTSWAGASSAGPGKDAAESNERSTPIHRRNLLLRSRRGSKVLTRPKTHRTLAALLLRINPVIRGWCTYFRHGVSKRTFSHIDHFAFWRIVGWLKKRHPKLNVHTVVRRFLPGWQITADGIEFFRANEVPVTRYRYRGTRI